MFTEPRNLDRAALAQALEDAWAIPVARLDYLPVGFGSHHWDVVDADGSRWFVTAVDLQAEHHTGRDTDDALAALDQALRTAVALRDAGLDFVLAPVPSRDGSLLCRLTARYTIRVEPFLDGASGQDGEFVHPEERRAAGTLVGRLHAASPRIPSDLPGHEEFALRGRRELEQALSELDSRWDGGPFAEPARTLLASQADHVRERMAAYDRTADRMRRESGSWVVTHGEPHSANVIRCASGDVRLVDWDTVLIGPRERDLWMVLDSKQTGWEEYRRAAGPVALNAEALALYPERWALAEICEYIALFRRPHAETEDTRMAWHELGEYLP